MGDEDRAGLGLAQDQLDLAAQPGAQRGVERGERLVEQHDRRLRRQRPGQRDALALAARRARAGSARPCAAGRRARARRARGLRRAAPRALAPRQPEGHVVGRPSGAGRARSPGRPCRSAGARAGTRSAGPATALAVDLQRAGVRALEAGDQPQQRRLAAAAGPEHAEQLAALDRRASSAARACVGPKALATPRSWIAGGLMRSRVVLRRRSRTSGERNERDDDEQQRGRPRLGVEAVARRRPHAHRQRVEADRPQHQRGGQLLDRGQEDDDPGRLQRGRQQREGDAPEGGARRARRASGRPPRGSPPIWASPASWAWMACGRKRTTNASDEQRERPVQRLRVAGGDRDRRPGRRSRPGSA